MRQPGAPRRLQPRVAVRPVDQGHDGGELRRAAPRLHADGRSHSRPAVFVPAHGVAIAASGQHRCRRRTAHRPRGRQAGGLRPPAPVSSGRWGSASRGLPPRDAPRPRRRRWRSGLLAESRSGPRRQTGARSPSRSTWPRASRTGPKSATILTGAACSRQRPASAASTSSAAAMSGRAAWRRRCGGRATCAR